MGFPRLDPRIFGMGVYKPGDTSTTAPAAPAVSATPAGVTGGAKGGSGSGSGSSSAKKSVANLGTIAGYNAGTSKDQFARTMANYDLADQQNRQLADVQFKQNSAKGADERFAQAKRLQMALRGLLSSAAPAMQGSGAFNLADMLRGRTDLDTGEVLSMLAQNQNQVQNDLDQTLGTNVVARNDAAAATEAGLRGIEADTSAQLNNIGSKYFVAPGKGAAKLGSAGFANKNKTPANVAKLAGYFLPEIAESPAANVLGGGSYFDKLLNVYNQGR